jgi:hypothetical protein
MILTVGLRGYPEAILATDAVTLDVSSSATAGEVVCSLAVDSPQLRDTLLRPDGEPRQSSKVMVDGTSVMHSARVHAGQSVVVLAALPCDG